MSDAAARRRRAWRWVAAATALVIVSAPVAVLVVLTPTSRGPQAPAPASKDLAGLEAAWRADPSPAHALDLAAGYLQAKRAAEAAPILEKLKASDRENPRVWNNLCALHNEQGDFALAGDACGKALSLAPGFQLARNNLAWAQARLQALQAKIDEAERTPPAARTAAFELEHGMLLLHAGQYEPAVEAWRRSLALDPRSARAANDIGVARMLQGRPREALSWFIKAQALDPALQLARGNEAWARQSLTPLS